MSFDQHPNLAASTVAVAPAPASSGTSLSVGPGDGQLFGSPPFNVTVWPTGSAPSQANAEILRVTGRATDTLTVSRQQEGSAARTIRVGDQIAATITAKTIVDVETVLGGQRNVMSFGAHGDSVTDDTAAFNAAISDTPTGGTLLVPPGTYLIDPTPTTGGVRVNKSMTLRLAEGAVLQAKTNALTTYAVVHVNAADVTIEGQGTIRGDVTTHTGSTGEWGHCLEIVNGADRCHVRGITCSNAWGDGIYIGSREIANVVDAIIEHVVCDSNRRQGLSVVGTTRLTVLGSEFRNTGAIHYTAPAAGVDVEPDTSNSTNLDTRFIGCTFTNNYGGGLVLSGGQATVTARVISCHATGNGHTDSYYGGINAAGAHVSAEFVGCTSYANVSHGFTTGQGGDAAKDALSLTSCVARGNSGSGFLDAALGTVYTACSAIENSAHGFWAAGDTGGDSEQYLGCIATANNQANVGGSNFFIYSSTTNGVLSGCISDAGTLSQKPYIGFAVDNSATGWVFNACSAIGSGYLVAGTYFGSSGAVWNAGYGGPSGLEIGSDYAFRASGSTILDLTPSSITSYVNLISRTTSGFAYMQINGKTGALELFQIDNANAGAWAAFGVNELEWRDKADATRLRLTYGATTASAVADFVSSVKIEGNVGFYNTTPAAQPTVTGSRGSNAALASLLTGLASLGLIVDSSS